MAEADPPEDRARQIEALAELDENRGLATSASWRVRAALLSIPLLIAAVGLYFWLTSGRFENTDNAYLKQDIVNIGGDVIGRIVEVNVKEGQMVKAGDVLFRIDPEPYQVALERANAALASAQVQIRQLQTDYSATSVDIEGAREDIAYNREEYERRKALYARGFTTKAALQSAKHDLDDAEESLRTALADAAKARAALATGEQVPGIHPALAAAIAERNQAALDLERTTVYAPVSGQVSQTDRLQVGQMMITGLPALSIVVSNRTWVDANFKETQLTRMEPGQPAHVTLDTYPGLTLKGHVESIGAGTGAEFSILPPQNATGNWVKVTQRVPVRVVIDEQPPQRLIAGLSAKVQVDIRKHGKER